MLPLQEALSEVIERTKTDYEVFPDGPENYCLDYSHGSVIVVITPPIINPLEGIRGITQMKIIVDTDNATSTDDFRSRADILDQTHETIRNRGTPKYQGKFGQDPDNIHYLYQRRTRNVAQFEKIVADFYFPHT